MDGGVMGTARSAAGLLRIAARSDQSDRKARARCRQHYPKNLTTGNRRRDLGCCARVYDRLLAQADLPRLSKR
jgi:hypothetical protein